MSMVRKNSWFGICCALVCAFVLSLNVVASAEEKRPMNTWVLGGGCFWCLDAVFRSFKGVSNVESGYAGGHVDKPTYEQVGVGTTGHAEVVRVSFDPALISDRQLLTVFFHAHDPTTKNRQGNDVGPQYRSIILYQNDAQRALAEEVKGKIISDKLWADKTIVTELVALERFYLAEDYHQDYFAQNKNQPYCALVIGPKLKKIKDQFKDLLR
jgi:peptide-methionine (S)-S-oxide reductase